MCLLSPSGPPFDYSTDHIIWVTVHYCSKWQAHVDNTLETMRRPGERWQAEKRQNSQLTVSHWQGLRSKLWMQPHIWVHPFKPLHHSNGAFHCGLFHIRQQFSHELSCNYKLCSAQLKVEDVSVREQTSTAVCQRASGGRGRGVKWGLRDLRYVLSSHLPLWSTSVSVSLSALFPLCFFLPGFVVMSLHESSTLVAPC